MDESDLPWAGRREEVTVEDERSWLLQGEHVLLQHQRGNRGGAPRLSEYGVKPMNCPGHVMLYKNDLHSYRDLPFVTSSSARSIVMR